MKYISLVFYLFLCTTLYAQENSPAAQGSGRLIEYSFKPGETNYQAFSKPFPFDQPFAIRFTDIPDTVTRVEVVLRKLEVNSRGKKNITEIATQPWDRPTIGETVTSGDVLVDSPLEPNAIYTAVVTYSFNEQLSEGERIKLAAALSADPGVQVSYHNMVNSLAKDTMTMEVAKVITAKINNMLTALKSAIVANNPDHRIRTIPANDYELMLDEVENFRNPTKNINNNLRALTAESLPESEDLKKVMAVRTAFDKVDWGTIDGTDDKAKEIYALLDAIDPERSQIIKKYFVDAIAARKKIPDVIINSVVIPKIYRSATLGQTYLENFVENARLYVTLDLGYAHIFRVDRWMAYSGANIYFRPVNKNLPLRFYTHWKDWLGVRTSLLVGVSLGSIEKEGVRKGLIDKNALVLGAGLRVTPFLKINGGAFIHYRYKTNPLLSDRYHTSLSPFVSLSIDLDAKTLFAGIGESIFK